ncbi:hypothetical protein SPF06_21555 [Sinomonas sp. JGH33]|uniref:DUF2971 domain-containing protein n=1 Tax=Sinomonas terricola TaxID=3110330 RepID=A0ABU5TC94_9MICC|nr:hypothetical protein [Sinomonas sp. JGH33]MEA5457312.1 hypothetical protein [Sinomonas sp. JGH33]
MALPHNPTFNAGTDLVSEEAWPVGTVWHYTTAAGLAGLVGGKVLWASAMAFMNDSQEMHTGKAVFDKLLETHAGEVDPHIRENFSYMVQAALRNDRYRTFIACASRLPDSLTMWRNYTSEVGFAVALDGTKPLLMRRQRRITEKMIGAVGYHGEESRQLVRELAANGSADFAWTPAVYDPAEQYKSAYAALRGIEATALARAESREMDRHELDAIADAAKVLPTFKNPAFRDEAEMRIVCGTGIHVDLMHLKHRPGRYGMIPYVELGIPEDRSQGLEDEPEPMADLPITGVVVGPTPYPEEARVGVLELLRSHGHETVPVIESRIPFRS